MAISTYLGNALLDEIFNATNYAAPANVYVSLHTADPGLTGANEVTAGANTYARQSGSFGASSAKAVTTDGTLTWSDMPSTTVTHVGIWDAVSGGNFLWGGGLTSSVPVSAGGTFQIATGDLDVSI